MTPQGHGNDLTALQQQLKGDRGEPSCHCLWTRQHIFTAAIYYCKKSAGPPGLGIQTSFISRNGFQWRAKSNSHLQGMGGGQEVPGNANLWVNPPHLIVLLFVCDIDSSGGDQEPPCPSSPLCIPRMCLFTDGPLQIYLLPFSLGFNSALHQRQWRGVIIRHATIKQSK